MTLLVSPKTKDILAYESEVWKSADVLRSSVGLKNSEFPDFMMPFFALRMVESRLIRKYDEVSKDTSLTSEADRIDEIRDTVGFYNSVVIEGHKTLSDIVQNDKTFYADFTAYLNGFDPELKQLLGIVEADKTENLNLASVVESLRKKNALFGYTSAWANIDFTPYDNSDITTLEEHIKRKWADMSAETAGEQYTPDDVINLISELIVTDNFKENYPYKLYDMTCGGGNMLYGVDDKIKHKNRNVKTETYGQELRGSLFALARIESMFRNDSKIEHGNTLTEDQFQGKEFDYGIANPPYGVSWKEEQKTIENDQTGRFGQGGYPSVSDGQLLFVQHMLAKLNQTGKAFIVLNGSPLFSGDAGSGESNIRKWILDNDWMEAIIQLPTNEFFNTGITTYIWCLNKNKQEKRKDKIVCINAETLFVKLKKNKGEKSKEISPEQALLISKIYSDYEHFEDSDISKVKSKYDFYFNKQSLKRLETDEAFGAFNQGKSSQKLVDAHTITITQRNPDPEDQDATDDSDGHSNPVVPTDATPFNATIAPILFPATQPVGFVRIGLNDLGTRKEDAVALNQQFKDFDNDEQELRVLTPNASYHLDLDHCIIETLHDGSCKNLGYGNIKVKANHKKATTKNEEKVELTIELEPVWTKDDEKIPFSPDPTINEKTIHDFLKRWVSEDASQYELLTNTIGVEVNFNSVFPKPITIRSTEDILADIADINSKLEAI